MYRGAILVILMIGGLSYAQGQCTSNPCQNNGVCTEESAVDTGYKCTCDLPDGTTGDAWKTKYLGTNCTVLACLFGYIEYRDRVDAKGVGIPGNPVINNVDECALQCDAVNCPAFVFGILADKAGPVVVKCGLVPEGTVPVPNKPEPDNVVPVSLYVRITGASGEPDCTDVALPGPIGMNGATGHTGQEGDPGQDGVTGDTGSTGSTGATGQDGFTGATGDQGDTGYTGDPGMMGLDGTNGENGLNGDDGVEGDTGTTGATGVMGPKGEPGLDGNPGVDPATGATGPTGGQGYIGDTGNTGASGYDGVNGVQGMLGPTGLIGVKGDQGDQGDTGDTGPIGDIGDMGPKGVAGFNPTIQDECLIGRETCSADPLGIAECIDMEISYMCRCQHFIEYGFTWSIIMQQCQIKESDAESLCEIENGKCDHVCVPGDNMLDYNCTCHTGYQLADDGRTCIDIDECVSEEDNECEQLCLNTVGSYTCDCTGGYYKADDFLTCEDIDECQRGNGGCSQECINTPGAYRCACNQIFELTENGHGCVSKDKVVITIPLVSTWEEALADKTSDEYKDLSRKVIGKFDFCFLGYTCSMVFSPDNGVTATLTIQSSSVGGFDVVETNKFGILVRKALASEPAGSGSAVVKRQVNDELVLNNDTPIRLYTTTTQQSWQLVSDVCKKYNDDKFCFGESYCEDVDGFPQCICPDGFVGVACDTPGPGYDTTPDFIPKVEVMQFGLIVAAIVLSLVAMLLTGSAVYKVVRSNQGRPVPAHRMERTPYRDPYNRPPPEGDFVPPQRSDPRQQRPDPYPQDFDRYPQRSDQFPTYENRWPGYMQRNVLRQ